MQMFCTPGCYSYDESSSIYLARNAPPRQLAAVVAEDVDGGTVLGEYLGELEHPVAQFIEVANGRRTTVVVATTEDVREGEEITADYGTDIWFRCRCGLVICRHREIQNQHEEDDEAVDVDSDDDNEGVSGTSSEEDAAATNLGADVISNDSDADECDTEADQPRAAQTIVV
ncbi:hypothetical protein PInf_002121 [Phytophthora infestans]|nr:hypothetical protein PInf_002121 [Phytophthora infestans]